MSAPIEPVAATVGGRLEGLAAVARTVLDAAFEQELGRPVDVRTLLVSDVGPATAREVGWAVARGCTLEHLDAALGSLMPGLRHHSAETMPVAEFGGRLVNALRVRELFAWGDVLQRSPMEILRWANVGVLTVEELVAHAIITALSPPMTSMGVAAPADLDAGRMDLVVAASEIAAFAAARMPGRTWLDALLEVANLDSVPPRVGLALSTLRSIDTQALAGDLAASYDVRVLASKALSLLNERELEVFLARPCSIGDVPELERLGRAYGVTRQRVQQIEAKAVGKVRSWLAGTEAAALISAADDLDRLVGVAVPLDSLPAQFDGLLEGDPNAQLVAWLAGPFVVEDAWLRRRKVPDLARVVHAGLRERARNGIVAADDVAEVLDRMRFRQDWGARWMAERPIYRSVADVVVLWDGGQSDKAELVLRLQGAPMSVQEIFDAIGEPISLRSLNNRLAEDRRFRRRGKDRWGLDEWGGDEYTSTIDLMVDEIDQRGGTAEVGDLVASLTARFPDMVPDTIRSYASSVNFVRVEPGVIRVRRPSDPYIAPGRVERARDCFVVDGHWALRIRVNSDHLRGSGFLVPTGFATHVGLRPSARVVYTSAWGDLSLGWRTQPQMSSIRSLIEQLGALEGDFVFLRFLPSGTVDARLVGAAELGEVSPTDRLLLSVGAATGASDPLLAVGKALGMPSPEHASIAEIESVLTDKREGDLIQLLPTSSDSSQAVRALIAEDEGQRLEKKQTLSYDVREGVRNKALEFACMKTIAGMLNAEGGTLLIGVTDDGRAAGLADDLRVLDKDLDRYELHLRGLLTNQFGDAAVAKLIVVRFHTIDGQTICEVRVDRSPDPVYLAKDGAMSLYVRTGNKTSDMKIHEAVKYVALHFDGDRYSREILEASSDGTN